MLDPLRLGQKLPLSLQVDIMVCARRSQKCLIFTRNTPQLASVKAQDEARISERLLATDMFLSWPKVFNLITVQGVLKTTV